LRALLESSGYTVETFQSGELLLNSASAVRADCFLFDLQMPVMTGVELLERLRARNIATPAILVSASGGKGAAAAKIRKGDFFKSFKKPVADDELLSWIEKACARKD